MTAVHITYHAVVRFLERHDGHDFGAFRDAMGWRPDIDALILEHVKANTGITVADVRRRMTTPALMTAIACGANGLRMGRVRFLIENGIVVTVRAQHHDMRPVHRPLGFARSQFVPLNQLEA